MRRVADGRHPAGVRCLALLAGMLAAGAAPLAAQVPRAPQVTEPPPAAPAEQPSALAEIDRLAVLAVALLRRHVPDRAGVTVWILPFATDTGAATRLGHRLQSAVHLLLLRDYRAAEIRVAARRPAAGAERALPAGAAAARHALELELQPFRDTLRVVLRVLGSGAVRAGEWIDLPVSEELRELLDDSGGGTGLRRSQLADAPSAGDGQTTGSEGPRTPLPSAIGVDRGQQRYTTSGEDWVTLQAPAPGFYLLEGRSFSGPLTLALHDDRAGPPVVTAREDVPAAAGGDPDGMLRGVDRRLGIFYGPGRSLARITTAPGEDVPFYLRLRPLNPSRRFADGTDHAVPLERGMGFQTLRVFRSGTYRVAAEADAGTVELRVFGVPHMRPVPPASTGDTRRFELPAGDYLVEVTSAAAPAAARMCWAAAAAAVGCAG